MSYLTYNQSKIGIFHFSMSEEIAKGFVIEFKSTSFPGCSRQPDLFLYPSFPLEELKVFSAMQFSWA